MKTKDIAKSAVVAAIMALTTLAIAPIAYGPFQFRVSGMLKPLALFAPWASLAFALGTAIANLWSPFGPWDYIAMPLVDALAAWVCWKLRARPLLAIVVQAAIVSAGVAVFPLWIGGKIPPAVTFLPILISQAGIELLGWFLLWKPRRKWFAWELR